MNVAHLSNYVTKGLDLIEPPAKQGPMGTSARRESWNEVDGKL